MNGDLRLSAADLASLRRAVGAGREVAALVVGDVMVDAYLFGPIRRLSPEAPVPIVEVARTEDRPGGAANAALNIAALGVRTSLVGVVGDDDEAARLGQALEPAALTVELVAEADRPTTVKTRIVAPGGQVARLDRETCSAVGAATQAAVLRAVDAAVERVDVVLLSDYAKGVFAGTLAQRVIERAGRAGVPVVVDPKGTDFGRYAGAHVVTPNLLELQLASGIDPVARGVDLAVRQLKPALPDTAVLVTKGAEGIELFDAEGSLAIDAHATEVIDVTGAGDTVAATLALALAAGLPLRLGAVLANVAASAVVRRQGAAHVEPDHLDRLATELLGPAVSG